MNQASSEITSEDIYTLLKEVNANLTEKINKVEKEVKSIRVAVELEIGEIKQNVIKLEQENKDLKNKIVEIESKIKNNNIVIYGLEEKPSENQTELIETFLQIVNNILMISLDKRDLNNIFRLGKKKNHSRPLLVSLISHIKKTEILRNSRNLKGTKIFIVEDLTEKALEDRKILVAGLKQAKAGNKSAKIKGNKLVIEDKTYTAEQIKFREVQEASDTIFSPPPVREVVSEPATPSAKVIDLDEETVLLEQAEIAKQIPSTRQQLQEERKEVRKKETNQQNLQSGSIGIGTPKNITTTRAQSRKLQRY